MAADLRLGQPYRAQLTVTVGGEAARREKLPATWRCSPCKAAPEGLVMVTPEQSSSPPMRAPNHPYRAVDGRRENRGPRETSDRRCAARRRRAPASTE